MVHLVNRRCLPYSLFVITTVSARQEQEGGEDVKALIKELSELARAALAGWPETARLCLIILVVAATSTWTIMGVHLAGTP